MKQKRVFPKEDKHKNWKGDAARYGARHLRIYKRYGRPTECAWCKKQNRETGKSLIEYANISGEYKTEREDWVCLCVSCHKKFDWDENTSMRISEAKRGTVAKVTQKTIDGWKRATLKKQKSVIGTTSTGESVIFPSIKLASETFGVPPSCIVHVCKGKRKTSAGMVWNYYQI